VRVKTALVSLLLLPRERMRVALEDGRGQEARLLWVANEVRGLLVVVRSWKQSGLVENDRINI